MHIIQWLCYIYTQCLCLCEALIVHFDPVESSVTASVVVLSLLRHLNDPAEEMLVVEIWYVVSMCGNALVVETM